MDKIKKLIRIWFKKRFPEHKISGGYYSTWISRWKNHCFVGNMDTASRETWMEIMRESDFGRVIHKHRGIKEAYIGQFVEVDGKEGMIVGWNTSCNLDVYFFGEKIILNCHPNWNIKYKMFEKVVREFDKSGEITLTPSLHSGN